MKASIWDNKIRPRVKKRFAEAGITYCQMCGRHDYLSFAHRVKRRYITTESELSIVALLCMDNPEAKGCHNKLEHGPKDVMYEKITELYGQLEFTEGHYFSDEIENGHLC